MHNNLNQHIEKKLSTFKIGNRTLKDFIKDIIITDNKTTAILECTKQQSQILQNVVNSANESLKSDNITLVLSTHTNPSSKPKTIINGVKKIITVASGKGGVGKSTIAYNIAALLSKKGFKVGIADLDIYGPSLPQLSGIHRKPALENNLIIPHTTFGVKLMSIGYLVDKDAPLIWRGPMTTKMLHQILSMTNWRIDGELDYLIIDTPPGTGDVHLSLHENYTIDAAIIVSSPQSLAESDVKRCVEMYKKFDTEIIGFIENYSFIENNGAKLYPFGKSDTKKQEKNLGISAIGQIPISQNINEYCENSKPLTYFETTGIEYTQFSKIIEHLLTNN